MLNESMKNLKIIAVGSIMKNKRDRRRAVEHQAVLTQ